MDATLKETNIWKSIKKFWLDGIDTTVTPVYFDRIVTTAQKEENQWICVDTEDVLPAHVSSALMNVYMFSKEDKEGDQLIALRDTILELLYDGRISLYDTSVSPWNKVGGMMLYIINQSGIGRTDNKVKMRYMEILLKWGAVWS